MIPSCILFRLWTSSKHVSPSKQSSTSSSQWIIKWHFSKRTKCLHHYPDTLYCHFERAEHGPLSLGKCLPPAQSNGKPDPDSPALQWDPATGWLSLGQKLDYFNKSNCNAGPEAEIFHLLLTNSARNLTAHPLNLVELRYASPDEKEDFTSSCMGETILEKTAWGPNSGVAEFDSETYSSGVPRLAMEDTHQKNRRSPMWTFKGTPFLVTSPLSSFPHLPH